MKERVNIFKGDNPAENAYKAIKSVFLGEKEGFSVLLKVNTGFKGAAKSGLTTHPEVVRGLIKFFKEQNAGKIYVGDSSIIGTNSVEALKSAGIWEVCEEEKVECCSLDDFERVNIAIPDPIMVDSLNFSKLMTEVDCLVSVPVMKTHMYAGVTLSIKNLKGCMYGKDKTKLHRINKPVPEEGKGKCLDYGICDLAKVCYPKYAVIDATIAMEGFGPSGGTPVDMGLVMASSNAIAADITALKLMGMEFDAIDHLNLVRELKNLDINDLEISPENYMDYSKKFMLANDHDLHQNYPNPAVRDCGACSACHAALIQFFRYHHEKFNSKDSKKATIILGKDIKPDDLLDENTVLVGNCTAKYKKDLPFCKGCPPIPSQIAEAVIELKNPVDF